MKNKLFLIIGLLFIFTGCFSDETETTDGTVDPSDVEVVEDGNVTPALEAYKAGDMEKFYSYFTEDVSGEFSIFEGANPEVLSTIANIDYKVQKVELGEDKGKVTVEITSLFVPAALGKTMDTALKESILIGTEEEIAENQAKADQLFLEMLNDPAAEKKTTEVKIDVKKVDGEWKLEPSDELFLALSGYYTE